MATGSSTSANPNLVSNELIWLDQSAGNAQESRHAEEHLRQRFNDIKFYKQVDHCEGYIRLLQKTARIIIVVSGRLGQEIVPRIHNLPQVSSIYVYCMNKQKYEQWAQSFPKIKGIVVSLPELVNKVCNEQNPQPSSQPNPQPSSQPNPQPSFQPNPQPNFQQNPEIHDTISFDILPINSPNVELKNSFIYSYYFIKCLLETNSSLTDKNDLIDLCKQENHGNENELKTLEEFQLNYFPSRALWWFTRSTYIYYLLNKSLDQKNFQALLLYRFFLHDIQRQLEKNKSTTKIKVYYGQLMTNNEINLLKNNITNFILINKFLLTTTKQIIQTKLSHLLSTHNSKIVLFEIEADPQLENIKSFANIKNLSYISDNDQTLFMLGSIFRLISVRQTDDGMWIIRMILCSENDDELKIIHEQYEINDILSYGQIFCQLKKFDQAEIYYKHLFKGLPSDHEDNIIYYDLLANLEKEKGNYDSSLQYIHKSMEIKNKSPQNDPVNIGDSYNNMGEIYLLKNDVKGALGSFDQAITMYKKKLNNDHPQIAICLNNMGHAYIKDKKYSRALEYYQKALVMRQKCLHPNHLQVAESYKHIGDTYTYMKDFQQAIDNYQKSLEIYEKSVPRQHLKIGYIFKSIAKIYDQEKKYRQARGYYEKAVTSFQQVLPATDPQFVEIEQNMQRLTTNPK